MYKKIIKRLLDIIFGLVFFPIFCVLFVLIGPIIHFTDNGSIFYCAPRLGKKGKVFNMYKFRSMNVNAPDIRNADGSTFNGEKDPRVTPIGRLLRKTSIDEIPQILNVIKGDMSIVGPRPTLPSDGFDYKSLNKVYKLHYSVRPGITGYSQAFYRNSISQKEKYMNDAYYAKNVTFLLDVKILFKTVESVLRRKNIYNN